MIDIANQNWHAELSNSSKLESYQSYKSVLEFESYLSSHIYFKHRIALTRFRCSQHKLLIEQGRHIKIDKQNRFCKYCLSLGQSLLENEQHFLLICPLYTDLRKQLLSKIIFYVYDLHYLFKSIMSSKSPEVIKPLSAYVYNAFIARNRYVTCP